MLPSHTRSVDGRRSAASNVRMRINQSWNDRGTGHIANRNIKPVIQLGGLLAHIDDRFARDDKIADAQRPWRVHVRVFDQMKHARTIAPAQIIAGNLAKSVWI